MLCGQEGAPPDGGVVNIHRSPGDLMSVTTSTHGALDTRPTTKQKVGLAICGVSSAANIPSALFPAPEGETGPPLGILVIGSLLGVVGLVCTVLAWKGNRVALRVAAGAIIVTTLTGLPAFFVDVPMAIKALVAFSVILTVVAVALMFSGRRPSPVVD
jgi:hypothetical protein